MVRRAREVRDDATPARSRCTRPAIKIAHREERGIRVTTGPDRDRHHGSDVLVTVGRCPDVSQPGRRRSFSSVVLSSDRPAPGSGAAVACPSVTRHGQATTPGNPMYRRNSGIFKKKVPNL